MHSHLRNSKIWGENQNKSIKSSQSLPSLPTYSQPSDRDVAMAFDADTIFFYKNELMLYILFCNIPHFI